MNFKQLALPAAISSILFTPAQADQLADLQAQLNSLQQKIQQMEAKQLETTSSGISGSSWTNAIEIGGVVEVEAQSVSADGSDTESDIYVATAELGITGKVNDSVSAEMVLLYEGPDGTLEVDAATITIAPESMPVSFTFGKTGVPFGIYESNHLSDPLTLELGETAVDATAIANYENNGLNASLAIFNGASVEAGNNKINDYVLNVGYAREGDFSFGIQFGYMNNLGNSDGLVDAGVTAVANDVSAFTSSIMLSAANLTFIGEYVGATESFNAGELAHNGSGATPKAWNTELAYSFGKSTLALGLQGTKEASAILAEKRQLIAYSVELYENTNFTLEYAREEDYGKNKTKTLTGQLAVEF